MHRDLKVQLRMERRVTAGKWETQICYMYFRTKKNISWSTMNGILFFSESGSVDFSALLFCTQEYSYVRQKG